MSPLIVKKFSSLDERRPFGHGHVDVLEFGDSVVGMVVLEPGWKWSKDVRPLVGTESCQVAHFSYCLSGRLVVKMDDGTRAELGPGDVALIPPGQDAWVDGGEPCVVVDFKGMGNYAQASPRECRGEASATTGVH
ncbi:cupin domain-containing protein [Stigmatella sp. ncwal1]|uniref:Cupin domain-containing protein n=1 Tax=Stigmatella ashevillensis TaxID=2995309 RepID=A0ABT5D595_9BACT|nr:cupin domain-containing protein [Stigmatella ashevillena]MDC0708833.1 cupin domain-containing protein [Stigmatella ashevillena]